MCPGMKDVVIVRDGGIKVKLQKQYLLTTLKEAHAMFQDEHPNNHISFSKFAELRPTEVQLQKDIPYMTCLCKQHENVRLCLVALQKAGVSVPLQFREFISKVVCDQASAACMQGTCTVCPHTDDITPSEDIEDHEVEWFEWSSNEDGKADKVVKAGTVGNCFTKLKNQLPQFLLHTYVKREQAIAFKQHRDSTKENESKIVLQVDFAGNNSAIAKDEIQSSYWSKNQITLFTCCAWEKTGSHSLAIVSDYLTHDKYAVAVFIDMIVKHFERKLHRFDELVVFSDGAASQFKQRFMLDQITHITGTRKMSWNFFATSHGKGAVDGVGGTLKRLVRTQVLSGGPQVQTAEQFAQTKVSNISLLHCRSSEIEERKSELDFKWQDLRPIQGLRQMHSFVVVKPHVILAKKLSNTQDEVLHYFLVPEELNSPVQITSPDHADTGDVPVPTAPLTCGQWLLVKYVSEKKSVKYYIGQVVNDQGDQPKVKFLKRNEVSAINTFKWPDKDDIDFVQRESVVMKLAQPQTDRRGLLSFPRNNLKNFNIQ